MPAIPIDRKCHLMMQMHDISFMPQCRPKHIRIGTKKSSGSTHARHASMLTEDADSEIVEGEGGEEHQRESSLT